MGKIGNISAISVPTQFEFVYLCFCFEFTIFWNLFSEHVFYVSVRLVRREQFVRAENQSLCRSFTCFCCLYWIPCSFDRFEERQIVLAKSCVLIGPYRSLLNFYEHSKLNCKTYFKCQLSTVNVWLCVFLLVCFIGLRFELHNSKKMLLSLSVYRCHFPMKVNLNRYVSRHFFFPSISLNAIKRVDKIKLAMNSKTWKNPFVSSDATWFFIRPFRIVKIKVCFFLVKVNLIMKYLK